MKITISHTKEEAREADLIHRFVRGMFPDVRTRMSDRHPPYFQLYLTTRKPEKPCKSRETT